MGGGFGEVVDDGLEIVAIQHQDVFSGLRERFEIVHRGLGRGEACMKFCEQAVGIIFVQFLREFQGNIFIDAFGGVLDMGYGREDFGLGGFEHVFRGGHGNI